MQLLDRQTDRHVLTAWPKKTKKPIHNGQTIALHQVKKTMREFEMTGTG